MSLNSEQETKRKMLRRSSSVLEREINELQETTKEAIERSWREESKLRRENSFKNKRITELEESLAMTSQRNSRTVKCDLDVDWNQEDNDEASCLSFPEDVNIQGNATDRIVPRSPSTVSKTPQDGHRKSFPLVPSMKSFFAQKNTQEEELMRQMAIMEELHKQQMSELELKLKQRETSISTLEKCMTVQNNTVDSFRKALETLEKKNRKLHEELDDKSKVIEELYHRSGFDNIPMKSVSKGVAMGSLNSRSSHVRRIKTDIGSLNSRSAHVRSSRRCLSMRQ